MLTSPLIAIRHSRQSLPFPTISLPHYLAIPFPIAPVFATLPRKPPLSRIIATLPKTLSHNSFPYTHLADPYPLSPVMSIFYKNMGGGALRGAPATFPASSDPEAIRHLPVFPTTYAMPILQAICFDNGPCNGGCVPLCVPPSGLPLVSAFDSQPHPDILASSIAFSSAP